MVIVKEQNFTNEGPQGDDDKCGCESKELKNSNEGPTEDECLEMKSSSEDNLEQYNSSNEETSGCKSLRHGMESEVIEVEIAIKYNMSIKETNENENFAELE